MDILGITAHPFSDSFSHALLKSALTGAGSAGCTTLEVDLYREAFNPALTREEILSRFSFDTRIQEWQDQVRHGRGLIIVYPDWWGMPPALLKGWLDRVFRPGVVFDYEGDEFGDKRQVPLLTGSRMLIITTGDDIREEQESRIHGLWNDIARQTGAEPVRIICVGSMRTLSKNQRRDWLVHAERTAKALFSQ